jgi:hypothetical protein
LVSFYVWGGAGPPGWGRTATAGVTVLLDSLVVRCHFCLIVKALVAPATLALPP